MASRVGVPLVLLLALAGCQAYDAAVYGRRGGVVEYPGSGARPDAPAIYVVRQGDTMDGIAQRFGVPASRIAERNSLSSPYKLSPGAWLEIPGARVVEASAPSGAAPGGEPASTSSPSGPVTSSELPPPPGGAQPPKPVAGALPSSSGAVATTSPTATTATPPKPVALPGAGAPKFEWPVRGRTVRGFGAQADGQRNDGVNIAAASGTPVKAAEGGTVVYSGSEVKGFGNLVLVSHAGGYVTAYAHLDKLSVQKGAAVKKGQSLGTVGTTGGVAEPQLHFEVRQRNKPVDPASVLP
ncbi:MAG: M23 family metallopeptidase [Rhodospirillales bacterium]|nr:MAG: M23 family metallopeptidase [Rhodospirillales bacterium]